MIYELHKLSNLSGLDVCSENEGHSGIEAYMKAAIQYRLYYHTTERTAMDDAHTTHSFCSVRFAGGMRPVFAENFLLRAGGKQAGATRCVQSTKER